MAAIMDSIEVKGVEIPLIYEPSSYLPTANLQIIFQESGSIMDGNLSGLASLSAKMLNEGTQSEGAVDFARKLENRAIHFSFGSGMETMVADLSCLTSELPEAVNLIRKLFREPNLTQAAFKKVKTDALSTIYRKKTDYDYMANLALMEQLYAGTPLETPSIGTEKDLEKITLEDVKSFLENHMVLKHVLVLAGGSLSIEEAKKQAKKLLKSFEKGHRDKLEHYAVRKTPTANRQIKETQQAYIYFGAPFYIDDIKQDLYKAKVAGFVLGSSGFGSRIMEEIRVKRGLAYSAYMRFNINKSHTYAFGYLQTKIENEEEAIKIVKQVVAEFIKKGVTQKELEGAKKFLLGSEPLRNETMNQRLSAAFSEYYKSLPIGYRKQELAMIEQLTLKDINAFIRSHAEIEQLTFSIITNEPEPNESQ